MLFITQSDVSSVFVLFITALLANAWLWKLMFQGRAGFLP